MKESVCMCSDGGTAPGLKRAFGMEQLHFRSRDPQPRALAEHKKAARGRPRARRGGASPPLVEGNLANDQVIDDIKNRK